DRSKPAAGGQKTRRRRIFSGLDLVAQLKWQIAEIGAHRHARGDAEISELVHMVEYVLARVILRPAGQVAHVTDVRVGIDQCWNDGIASEIDARRPRRYRHVAAPADRGDAAVLNHDRGPLDRRARAAGDESRPCE